MNRRGFVRSILATAAMATGLAHARLELVDDEPIEVKSVGQTWSDGGLFLAVLDNEGGFMQSEELPAQLADRVFDRDALMPWSEVSHSVQFPMSDDYGEWGMSGVSRAAIVEAQRLQNEKMNADLDAMLYGNFRDEGGHN